MSVTFTFRAIEKFESVALSYLNFRNISLWALIKGEQYEIRIFI